MATRHDHGDRWDAADVKELLRLAKRGWTYDGIAYALGRSVGAVRSKLYRLRAAS